MLRDYQKKAIEEITQAHDAGLNRVLLCAPTGAGKSLVFCTLAETWARQGHSVCVVVRGRKLVDQASKRLSKQGLKHGVYMAGHYMYNPIEPIQVASIDTIRARDKKFHADYIIIDEAHFATSMSFHMFIKDHAESKFLSVTATPYPREGLGHLCDKYVETVHLQDLIDQGYLVPPVYYGAKEIDLKGIKKSAGDYNSKQLGQKMSESVILGDVVKHWIKYGENRPTLCFAATIEHSLRICSEFTKHGIKCEHLDANSTDEQRQDKIDKLSRGDLNIISNVGILGTGVDIPEVSCIIMARPTQSEMLYIQQAGRGTRLSPGKQDFILLDHAGNIHRHGFLSYKREPVLAPKDKKETTETEIKISTCESCYHIYETVTPNKCPMCGFQKESAERKPADEKDVELAKLIELTPERRMQQVIDKIKEVQKERDYKKAWAYFQVMKKYGYEIAAKHYPWHGKNIGVPEDFKLPHRPSEEDLTTLRFY